MVGAYLDEPGQLDEDGQPKLATKLMNPMENLARASSAPGAASTPRGAGIDHLVGGREANLEAALVGGAGQLRHRMALSEEEQP